MKMTSRVTPIESRVVEITDDTEAQGFSLVQPVIKGDSSQASRPNEENFNGELLRAVEEMYSPVLKMMKMLGMYFGDTTLNRFRQTFVPCRKKSHVSRFYCGVIVAGLWFNFSIPLISVFFGANIYLFMIFLSWCLLVALNLTTLLIVLPLTDTRKSRLEKFLRKAISINTENVKLGKVKFRARIFLIIFSLLFIAAVVLNVINDLMLDMNFGSDKPWNVWIGFRIISFIFLLYGCAVWLLPFPFFCITCLILESLFNDFNKRILSPHSNSRSVQISAVRREHHKLCEVVELADSMLSSLLLQVVAFYIPVICFNFYQVGNLADEETATNLIIILFWLLVSSAILAVIMVLASRVNEKVSDKINHIF